MPRVADQVEDYLAADSIKLHRCVAKELAIKMAAIAEKQKPPAADPSRDFPEHLELYLAELHELVAVQALLGHWSSAQQRPTLRLMPLHLSSFFTPADGPNSRKLAIAHYPALLTLYAGGVGAVSAERYDNLRELLQVEVPWSSGDARSLPFMRALTKQAMHSRDHFKQLPGLEGNRTAQSDHLALVLQPIVDEFLALGSRFDFFFDRFEVLYALEHAYQDQRENKDQLWGPPGRFAWKIQSADDPFRALLGRAQVEGSDWPPLRAGFFGGSLDTFTKLAGDFTRFIHSLNWH